MKKLLVVLAMAGFLFFTTSSYAGIFDCPPGQEKKGWKCVDIEEPDDGGVTVTNNNDNSNRNTNLNTNFNTNTNTNVNTQGQAQGQIQGQMQGQTANNEGVEQSVTIKEAKIPVNYNHIPSGVGKTDADLVNHSWESDIRTLTSIFMHDDDDYITSAEAKKASSGADIDVIKAVLWEGETQLKNINYVETSGKYMGSLTLTTEDATLDQVLARACKEAMYLGATSVGFVTKDAKKVSATKYGVDFGSSASVAAKADGSIMIAPGATLGWSKAVASNIIVGEVYAVLFRDESLIE